MTHGTVITVRSDSCEDGIDINGDGDEDIESPGEATIRCENEVVYLDIGDGDGYQVFPQGDVLDCV